MNELVLLSFPAWLKVLLKKRHLEWPDQRPLFGYQVSTEEYDGLKRLLITHGNRPGFVKDKAACACFVLFCSEWYRREYLQHDGWSWDPIWNTLGYAISAQELASIIPRGLESYWNRRVRYYESERRNFLGSVFSEGGLPFRVLKEANSRVQGVFSRILKQHEHARLLRHSTSDLVERVLSQSKLPQVFSEQTSVELIASIADELLRLVNLYALNNQNDPAKFLDTVNPRWRDAFPLPLDDDTGTDLLNGLLRSAVKESSSENPNGIWRCVHHLNKDLSGVLKTDISLPAEVNLRLESALPTCRFDLAVFEGDRQVASLGAGYAMIQEGNAIVKIRQRLVSCRRFGPSRELVLVATVGGSIVAKHVVAESEVHVGEAPLGFAENNDRWELVGQASFRTKSDEVLLVVPHHSVIDCAGDSLSEELQCLEHPAYLIVGQADISVTAEDEFEIKTGVIASSSISIELKGKSPEWPCTPALVFYGPPQIAIPVEEIALRCEDLQLYVSGKAIDLCGVQEKYGSHFVSVRNKQGKTFLRRRIGVLPSDLKIELKNGKSPKEGYISFSSNAKNLFQVKNDNVAVKVEKREGVTELHLVCDGLPPSTVSISITPNLEAAPVHMELPFPGSGCLLFNADGKKLSNQLVVGDLLGARAFLFANSDVSAKYLTQLYLVGGNANRAGYRWEYLVKDRPIELRLNSFADQIKNLFSLNAGIDQRVELSIRNGGNETSLSIRRYAYEHVIDRMNGVITKEGGGTCQHEDEDIVLMLLTEPESKPRTLSVRRSEGVATGEYDLPTITDTLGPWLLLPQKDAQTYFRPQFIKGMPSEFQQCEIKTLQNAVQAFDPKGRHDSFTAVLDAMANDPLHCGWQFLKSLYDQYGYLPMATFEVWKAILRHPSALAMSLFRFEMAPDFLSRLENEFPFFWEFFPLGQIRIAAGWFKTYLLGMGISEEQAINLMDGLYAKLGSTFPSYRDDLQIWLSKAVVPPGASLPVESLSAVVGDWYQTLIQNRSDETWPDSEGTLLCEWYESFTDASITISPNMSYQNSVVYLPFFAAAVASGRARYEDIFPNSGEVVFFLRQVRDFDLTWFLPVYQLALLRFTCLND